MADFNGTILTSQGRDLLAKAIAGEKLEFTKIEIGEGEWKSDPQKMTKLVKPIISLPINEIEVKKDGTLRLRFVLTNENVKKGFFTREIGIFARGKDNKEKLYAVTYSKNPDFIPTPQSVVVEQVTDIYTVVSNAKEVKAIVDDKVVIATKEELNNLKNDLEIGKIKVGNSAHFEGLDISRFAYATDVKKAQVNGGWVTIAVSSAGRTFSNIYIVSDTSGRHDGLHLEFFRSYQNADINILSYTAHGKTIQKIRILKDKDSTYGKKYLQIYITSKLRLYVYQFAHNLTPYKMNTIVTPVVQNSIANASLYKEIRLDKVSTTDGVLGTSGALVGSRLLLRGEGIRFDSWRNYGSDSGYIKYDEDNNNYNIWGDSGENSVLRLGVTNDGANRVSDVVALESPAGIFFNAPYLFRGKKGALHKLIDSSMIKMSLGTNGYMIFPPDDSGKRLIWQWGRTGRFYTDKDIKVTFPIKFPKAVLNFQATREVGVNIDDWANFRSLTTSNVVIRAEYNGQGGKGYGYARWFAIGY